MMMHQSSSSLLLLLLLLLSSLFSSPNAFLIHKSANKQIKHGWLSPSVSFQSPLYPQSTPHHHRHRWAAAKDDDDKGNDSDSSSTMAEPSLPALMSGTDHDPSTGNKSNAATNAANAVSSVLAASSSATTTTTTASSSNSSNSVATMMMRQENKRILIEELSYKRSDVERLRFEIVPVLVQQRVRCPTDGVPEAWCRSSQELARDTAMLQKLEQESKYPLKVPLLGISVVLLGKGLSDAVITLIKVNTNFPGASLSAEFMGVPVLLIDVVCVIMGGALGWWTWTNMKD